METLRFDEIAQMEDMSERIEGSDILNIYFQRNHHIPFMISSVYKGYLSVISLEAKRSGRGISNSIVFAEPMSLARF